MEYVFPIHSVPSRSWRSRFGISRLLEHVHDHFFPHPRNNYHPHILSHRSVALFSVLLVTLKMFTLSLLTFAPAVPAFSSAITPENIVQLTNESRVAYGLGSLKENGQLAQAAQAKAEDMLAKGYFSHTSPDGRTPWDFISASGYGYMVAGENLAVNFSEAENVEEAWMNSPGHKANILNKNFEEIGIGISQGEYQGRNSIFVVQMFGTPSEQVVALQSEPTIVQTQAVPEPAGLRAVAGEQSPANAPTTDVQTDILEPASPAPVAIVHAEVRLQPEKMLIQAETTGDPVKVLAIYGAKAVLMQPKGAGIWEANLDPQKITNNQETVRVKAYDLAGKFQQTEVAQFAGSTPANYNVVPPASTSRVQWLGRAVNPRAMEQQFYLGFIAAVLTSLVIAIAVRRHVQHVSVVANGAFVVILASLLLAAG